ncbi:MAG: glycoside hydrolase family 2 protein [Yoonia sp.]|nr:glycoside hydrolase family 2 protein [Yoonia sp.]
MTVELAGLWSLSDDSGGNTCDLFLPGDGISALHTAGLIPDPYWGRNEYDLRWICERDWTATRVFDLTDTDVDLVLSMVDTVVTVRVNDVVVLNAQNSFRDYRVPLVGAAKLGENTIQVTFHSPVKAGQAAQDAHPFFLPWQTSNSPIPNGNMLRKMQCDFGWDWNIALAPFGIYGDIRVEPSAAPRIDSVLVHQDHSDGCTLTVTTEVANHTGDVTIIFDGQTHTASPVNGTCTHVIDVVDPKVWWPAGQGDQPLYDMTVTAKGAHTTLRVGLRNVDLVTTPDAAGLGFKFSVNGRDVFAKGANWIPADALAGRITPAATRDLLQSAVDANMNMIRVWGGGRYEPTWFYDICDELGLMIWQDFMFACNTYPSTRDFLAEVRAEVTDNVSRLQHHACLALWCGDNELIGTLTWFDETRDDRDRYLVNYDRLNTCIENALLDTDHQANWWPSSPSPGPLNFKDAWHEDGSGDMHFWSVWHEGRDFDHYREVSPRFCSEFGFQSYPSMNAIRKFAGPDDMNIAAPVLESHQKNVGGNARIAETMFRYFRWPKHFDDFVYLSQVQQGEAIKTAVTHWRSLAPHCMGTLIWQLNDTWPVCSWASLDHGGDWKLMHHMARRFYAPTLVTAVPKDGQITIKGVNDAPAGSTISVKTSAVDMHGTQRVLAEKTARIDANSSDLMTLSADLIGEGEMLLVTWQGDDGAEGQDIFAPRAYKTYDLLAPNLRHTITRNGADYIIDISCETLALFVAVEADVAGRISDNAITILPKHPVQLRFTPADPCSTPKFTLRDLHSATYA